MSHLIQICNFTVRGNDIDYSVAVRVAVPTPCRRPEVLILQDQKHHNGPRKNSMLLDGDLEYQKLYWLLDTCRSIPKAD
jgi:hypothetical protein